MENIDIAGFIFLGAGILYVFLDALGKFSGKGTKKGEIVIKDNKITGSPGIILLGLGAILFILGSAVNTGAETAKIIMNSTTPEVRTKVNNPTAFAISTTNVGQVNATDVSFKVVVPPSIRGLAYQVNMTNSTGNITIDSITGMTIAKGAQPTFGVFIEPTQPIAEDPGKNILTLQLVDGSGKIIGAVKVPISTT